MGLPTVYTLANGQLPAFFAQIQEGQAPTKFTQQHLKDIGFTTSNHRAFIPLLKTLGFLSSDGTPTDRYQAYRDGTQSRKILGEALKEAYSDLFVIKSNPTDKDKSAFTGKFKSTHNASDLTAERLASTFLALLKIADIDHAAKKKPPASTHEAPASASEKPLATTPEVVAPQVVTPGLYYNIQIHLPATKDVEVYNAIFKSLREHLVG